MGPLRGRENRIWHKDKAVWRKQRKIWGRLVLRSAVTGSQTKACVTVELDWQLVGMWDQLRYTSVCLWGSFQKEFAADGASKSFFPLINWRLLTGGLEIKLLRLKSSVCLFALASCWSVHLPLLLLQPLSSDSLTSGSTSLSLQCVLKARALWKSSRSPGQPGIAGVTRCTDWAVLDSQLFQCAGSHCWIIHPVLYKPI